MCFIQKDYKIRLQIYKLNIKHFKITYYFKLINYLKKD